MRSPLWISHRRQYHGFSPSPTKIFLLPWLSKVNDLRQRFSNGWSWAWTSWYDQGLGQQPAEGVLCWKRDKMAVHHALSPSPKWLLRSYCEVYEVCIKESNWRSYFDANGVVHLSSWSGQSFEPVPNWKVIRRSQRRHVFMPEWYSSRESNKQFHKDRFVKPQIHATDLNFVKKSLIHFGRNGHETFSSTWFPERSGTQANEMSVLTTSSLWLTPMPSEENGWKEE